MTAAGPVRRSAGPVGPGESGRPGARLAGRLALIAGVWILYFSLRPLDVVTDLGEVGRRMWQGLADASVGYLPTHALSMMLLGGILGLRGALRGCRRPLLPACSLLLFCVALECLQGTVASRHPRSGDLLLNLVIGLGTLLATRRIAGARDLLRRLGRRARLLSRLLSVAWLVLITAWTLDHEWRHSLTTWNPGHALVLGDELTWNRPWQGHIQGVAVYGRSLEDDEVRRLGRLGFKSERGIRQRQELGAVVLYDLSGIAGARVPDRSAMQPACPLDVSPPVVGPPGEEGLLLDASRRVRATRRAAKLVCAAGAGSELTVEVLCSTRSLHQGGPARIVSFSRDPYHRNFTLAQEKDRLVFLVRSPASGKNGSRHAGRWAGVFTDLRAHHLVATCRRGRFRLLVDGVPARPWRPELRQSPVGDAAIHVLLLFLPLALLARLGWCRTPLVARLPCEALLAGAVVAGASVLGSRLWGTPWDATLPLVALGAVPLADLAAGGLERLAVGAGFRLSAALP